VIVDLPVILDLVCTDLACEVELWRVEATIDLCGGEPALTTMVLQSKSGLDTARLQREFRWNSPLEAVTRIVPRMLAEGLDPYAHEFPQIGYPEASHPTRRVGRSLTVEFLEDIAREYLAAGRGYTTTLAQAHHVSPRTVVSWIEKARGLGILTPVAPGQFGGTYVARSKRTPRRR